MKKLPPKAKLLCTISIFCLLLGCTSQTHVFKDEMKVEKISDIYPELYEICTSQGVQCLINGGSENAIYFALYEDNISDIQALKRFDRNTHEISTLLNYEPNQDIHLVRVVELGDMLIYTEETPCLESEANVVEYSVRSLKDGQVTILDSGVYPNTPNTIWLNQVGDSVVYATLDYEKNDELLVHGNGMYGYKVGKIDKNGQLEIIDSGYSEVKEFEIDPASKTLWRSLKEYTMSDFFLSVYAQNDDDILTYFYENGESIQYSSNELVTEDKMGIVGWYANGILLATQEKDDLYLTQSKYTFYDFEDKQWYDLGIERAMANAKQCTNDVFNVYADNGSKHHIGNINYLVTANKNEIVFKELDLGEYNETQFAAMALPNNQILLFTRTRCPDAFLISY